MALEFELSTSLFFCLVPLLFLFFFFDFKTTLTNFCYSNSSEIPKSYPIIGSCFSIFAQKGRRIQWTSDVIHSTPNLTFTFHRSLGFRQIFTANPSNVQHILKTPFIFTRKAIFRRSMEDFLGNGIFNADGESWKYQRKVASHEFNTKSLRKFVETIVDTELSERLIPILSSAAANNTILDFQDILQRFGNICKTACGYDSAYLLPSLPQAELAIAIDEAVRLSSERFNATFQLIWKIKRTLNIG